MLEERVGVQFLKDCCFTWGIHQVFGMHLATSVGDSTSQGNKHPPTVNATLSLAQAAFVAKFGHRHTALKV